MFENDESAAAVGKRLRRIRQMAGLKRSELAREAEVGKTSISYWEHAKSESSLMTATSRKKILDTVRRHGVECTERWLLTGTGPEPKMAVGQPLNPIEPILVDVLLEGKQDITLADELRLFLSTSLTVVIKISDSSMLPLLGKGDLVGGIWLPGSNLLSERTCIVEINGKLQARCVRRTTNNLFHLSYTAFDANQSEPYEIKDIHLERIAPITRIWY